MAGENVICPLCMENLDIDDKSFYPCTCGYQICRFCWHRIRSESDDQNSLCPACRKQYSENPAVFKPLSAKAIQKLKLQKRQKEQQKKQKSEHGRRNLSDLRVVQKNLVFVVGISPRIANPDVLKKNEFFGKYGKIKTVEVNSCFQQGTTASAYITYIRSEDALRAIHSVNNIPFDGKTIKVSLGTTKYCSHFLRNENCPKPECTYLHHHGDPDASFTKEDMQAGKHQDYEKKLLEEFNTHLNNNNNENSENGVGFSLAAPTATTSSNEVCSKKKSISNGSSIQQGVSYSTKLLVNNPTIKSENPVTKQQAIETITSTLESTHIGNETPQPSSSSSDSSVSSAPQIQQPERQESPPPLPPALPQVVEEPISNREEITFHTDGEDQSQSDLDLDFDPFHETQKAFEQIMNEQVDGFDLGIGAGISQRFDNSRDYSLGFQNNEMLATTTACEPIRASYKESKREFHQQHVQQPHHHSPAIPPPPGFSSNTTLDKLPQQLQLHRGNIWGNEMVVGNNNWMSLDPAIIFCKSSGQQGQGGREDNSPLFRGNGNLGGNCHLQQGYPGLSNQQFRNVFSPENSGQHALLRPTPTNSILQSSQQQYFPQQPVVTNASVVIRPPPGFGVL